jgi:hypothetical protein
MEDASPNFWVNIGGSPRNVAMRRERYAIDGGLAVQLIDEADGMPYATVSINVEGLDLAKDEFVFKTYSENEGLREAMIEAGIVERTGRWAGVGPICRLLGRE